MPARRSSKLLRGRTARRANRPGRGEGSRSRSRDRRAASRTRRQRHTIVVAPYAGYIVKKHIGARRLARPRVSPSSDMVAVDERRRRRADAGGRPPAREAAAWSVTVAASTPCPRSYVEGQGPPHRARGGCPVAHRPGEDSPQEHDRGRPRPHQAGHVRPRSRCPSVGRAEGTRRPEGRHRARTARQPIVFVFDDEGAERSARAGRRLVLPSMMASSSPATSSPA